MNTLECTNRGDNMAVNPLNEEKDEEEETEEEDEDW